MAFSEDWLYHPPLSFDQVLPREELTISVAGISQQTFIGRPIIRGLSAEIEFRLVAHHPFPRYLYTHS